MSRFATSIQHSISALAAHLRKMDGVPTRAAAHVQHAVTGLDVLFQHPGGQPKLEGMLFQPFPC